MRVGMSPVKANVGFSYDFMYSIECMDLLIFIILSFAHKNYSFYAKGCRELPKTQALVGNNKDKYETLTL